MKFPLRIFFCKCDQICCFLRIWSQLLKESLMENFIFCAVKLSFVDSFQLLSSSLNSLVKNLDKNDFKYLSQETDNNVWDIIMQKVFYSFVYNLKSLKTNCLAKKSFRVPWQAKQLVTKNMNMFLMFGINVIWKQWKIIMTFAWNVTFCF